MVSSTERTEVLGVVQARGGSKSIPRKNLRRLAGHPLIAYSIAAGRQARRVTRLIVSTDDPEIASVSRSYGAEVPFLRPSSLAQDESPDLPLFQHALSWLRDHEGYRPDVVVQLRPTSPLRPPGLLDQAIDALCGAPDVDSVRAVTPAGQNPYKMWSRGDEGRLEPLLRTEHLREPYNMPRQALPPVFWQTGHVDVFRPETIEVHDSLTGTRVMPVIVDRAYCVDVDVELDWAYAEWLLTQGKVDVVVPRQETAVSRPPRRAWPDRVRLLALDFDGVLTDNRVWVFDDGTEAVACNRSDGLGLERLRERGIEVIVISKETSPVVAARCRKLGVRCWQGADDKEGLLRDLAAREGIESHGDRLCRQ